ncbi:MAG TPA: DUF4188 domain-containing protein [Rhizomicrobium sp.]|jgi:hypothetical protein|nr:DUF4188 domain-containing protein [Rhizomicrobium sp.]
MNRSSTVVPGRMTARLDKPVVLFLIGARFNRLRSFPKWAWFARTMPMMLAELEKTPEAGLLWYRTYISWPNVMVQQYWESFDKLMAYSGDKGASHQPAWARYMRELAQDGSVGIWHETYLIEPGKFECIYGNMPPFGLGAATAQVKAEGRLAAARERFAA